MIAVLKIRVSKDRLRALPLNERALFILLGYAANQLNLFSKILLFSLNKTSENEIESTLSGAQSQMLLRVVIGVLHEAWTKIITNRLLKSPLGKEYVPRLDQGGRDALDALNKLFGGSNLLSKFETTTPFITLTTQTSKPPLIWLRPIPLPICTGRGTSQNRISTRSIS